MQHTALDDWATADAFSLFLWPNLRQAFITGRKNIATHLRLK